MAGGGGKGPAQLTAMAISQLRNAFIYAYGSGNYVNAGFFLTAMHGALPKQAELKMEPMPTHTDDTTKQDTMKNYGLYHVKPWIDKWYPQVEHALSEYIDNFYRTNPKMAGLY